MSTRERVGRSVRFFRKSRRLTTQQLADKLEVSRPYISQVESGRYNLSLDKVDSFANALEVTPLQLLMDYPDAEK